MLRKGGYKARLGIQGYKGRGMELEVGREDWEEAGVTTMCYVPTALPKPPPPHTNSYQTHLAPHPLNMAWLLLITPFIPLELHKKQKSNHRQHFYRGRHITKGWTIGILKIITEQFSHPGID